MNDTGLVAPVTAATGNDGFASKVEYAKNRRVSVRTVTNWIQHGMPHLKCGHRKVLIETAKADGWLRGNFEVIRRPSNYRPRGNPEATR